MTFEYSYLSFPDKMSILHLSSLILTDTAASEHRAFVQEPLISPAAAEASWWSENQGQNHYRLPSSH